MPNLSPLTGDEETFDSEGESGFELVKSDSDPVDGDDVAKVRDLLEPKATF